MTGRALESLTALLIVLGISLVGPDPSIGWLVFAGFLILCAAGTAISPVLAIRAYRSARVKPVAFNLRLCLASLLCAAYAAGGATPIAQAADGLHWLPFGFVLAVSIAASNAWALLVEILR